jgi:4-phytase/acid phosphatase
MGRLGYNHAMLRNRSLLAASILVTAFGLVLPSLAPAADRELKLAVILSRHGVRSPTSVPGPPSVPAWPTIKEWKVSCPGYLTDRGSKLLRYLGAYYREYFGEKGILPAGACPAPYVYIWADSDERTIKTAKAVRDGLAEGSTGCDINVGWYMGPTPPASKSPTAPAVAESSNNCPAPQTDPLFHPLGAHVNTLDTKRMTSILKSLQSRQNELMARFHQPLLAVQQALGCDPLSGVACAAPLPLTSSYNIGSGDSPVKWSGPFDDASTAAETFFLEYADGMPCRTPQDGQQTGWGRVDFGSPDCSTGQTFRELESIHTLYFDLTQRALYPARVNGSNLVNYIVNAMQDRIKGEAKGSVLAGKRLVFLAGHDTNVANVSAMLDMSWDLPDLPRNDTPPGGAIVFELYGTDNPQDWAVKIRYVHQTVEQLRSETVLSLKEPPNWVDLAVPGCPWGGVCPFNQFQTAANNAIDRNFVSKGVVGQ